MLRVLRNDCTKEGCEGVRVEARPAAPVTVTAAKTEPSLQFPLLGGRAKRSTNGDTETAIMVQ